MLGNPTVRLSLAVQTLCMGILFTMLSMVQPVYDITFGRADSFPFCFAAVAVVSASASFLNAVFVVRLGMRRIVTWSLGLQIVLARPGQLRTSDHRVRASTPRGPRTLQALALGGPQGPWRFL